MLDKAWRLIATGLSFFIFGVGGLLIPFLVVPLVQLFSLGKNNTRHQRGKAVIHNAFRAYIELMRLLGVLTYSVEGREKLENAQLVLANHPTLIDVVFLISLIPNANCVVKSALLKNPFTRWPVLAAGYIINNNSVDEVIAGASQAFGRGEALIVFPEGTRSVPDKKLKLKRGASNIAVRTATDITPVTIFCEPITLTKGAPWYQIPETRPHFTIQAKEVIPVKTYVEEVQPSMAARMLTKSLTQYFNREVGFE